MEKGRYSGARRGRRQPCKVGLCPRLLHATESGLVGGGVKLMANGEIGDRPIGTPENDVDLVKITF